MNNNEFLSLKKQSALQKQNETIESSLKTILSRLDELETLIKAQGTTKSVAKK